MQQVQQHATQGNRFNSMQHKAADACNRFNSMQHKATQGMQQHATACGWACIGRPNRAGAHSGSIGRAKKACQYGVSTWRLNRACQSVVSIGRPNMAAQYVSTGRLIGRPDRAGADGGRSTARHARHLFACMVGVLRPGPSTGRLNRASQHGLSVGRVNRACQSVVSIGRLIGCPDMVGAHGGRCRARHAGLSREGRCAFP